MKKMYFFTKNTPAYQYITLGMVLSCTILIEVIALPFSYSVSYNIPYKYQNIISILSSISTGYIITYFYFIIITYAEKKGKRKNSYFVFYLFTSKHLQSKRRNKENKRRKNISYTQKHTPRHSSINNTLHRINKNNIYVLRYSLLYS